MGPCNRLARKPVFKKFLNLQHQTELVTQPYFLYHCQAWLLSNGILLGKKESLLCFDKLILNHFIAA